MYFWKSLLSCLIAVFLVATLPAASHADPVLRAIDAHRVPHPNAEVRIEARVPGGQRKEFQVFMNDRNESVVRMLTGAEQGRYVLMTDTSFYLFIPTTSRPVRISPLQRLVGDANFGDIGRLTFNGSYRIVGRAASAAPGGPPRGVGFRMAGSSYQMLELRATKRTSTYARIVLWVTADQLIPVRADYFLTSGKHQKTAWFSPPEAFSGSRSIRTMALANPTPPHNVTVVRTVAAQSRDFRRRGFSVNGFYQIN